MKKIFSLVCLLLLTTVLLVGCGSEKKKLVIGLDDHFPPMGFRDDKNNLVGFDIDVGNAICEKLQAKCVWVDQPFDSLIPGLQARKFDLIHASITRT